MTREERLAKKRAYNKIYYANHRDVLVAKKRAYYEENREKVNAFQRQYIARNKEVVRQRKKEYYARNRDKILEKGRKYYQENLPQMFEYRSQNRARIRAYEKNRYQMVPQYRIAITLRARVRDAVRRGHKSAQTEELLGITFLEFSKYLESKFQQGMSWKNYGDWEIDHIIPLASFNLTLAEEQKKAFHYTNTQPLWKQENRQKSARILY